MDYPAALDAVRRRHGAPLAPGSEDRGRGDGALPRLLRLVAPDKVDRLLDATYAEDVWFNDTLKCLEGRAALGPYLRHSAEAVEDCRVEVHEILRQRTGRLLRALVDDDRFKRFARGRDTHSIGMSHLRFDASGRVVLHQDFWNAAEGLYQHVPLLGAGIRAIQRRL